MRNQYASLLTGLLLLGSQSLAQAGNNDPYGTSGDFDYYLLSLSWSPTYCLTHPTDGQCTGTKGYGTVLHGLWPQYTSAKAHDGHGWPQFCPTSQTLDKAAREFGNSIFPSPKLVSHEWSKHGTCAGLSAMDYFKAADQVRDKIKLPASLESPSTTRSYSLDELRKAILDANPGMPARALTLSCQGPELAEIRVCTTKTLQATECASNVRDRCSRDSIRVPAVR
jgi:ribonuclease T2